MVSTCFPYHLDNPASAEGLELVNAGDVVLVHIDNFEAYLHKFQHPCRINAFFAIVCAHGELQLSSHLRDYTLQSGNLFIAHSSVMQFHSCKDCEIYIASFTNDFISDMQLDKRLLTPPLMTLRRESHLIEVPMPNVERIRNAFTALYKDFDGERTPLADMALKHLFCSLVYRLCDSIDTGNTIILQNGVKDRSSEYLERLMTLLVEHYRSERSVEFYAEKMHISPKHLSRVIRNLTGRSVHQWIDEFIILEIKNLLRYSSLSIQQISYELNFPNPSFMGQYFKRVTGMTPGQYKKL